MIPLLLALLPAPDPDPPLSDLDRFPPAALVEAQVAFAAEHRKWLTVHAQLCPSEPGLSAWIAEADECAGPWLLLAAAQRWAPERYGGRDARNELAALRKILGPGYATGTMPPCVPHWRFARID